MSASGARRQRGLSLIEVTLTIVVVGVALVGVLSVFTVTTQHSADPMIRQQVLLIAESYMEEILIKRFYDPDTNTVCTGTTEGSRVQYDNVCDYNSLPDTVVRDQFGNAIPALAAYQVQVSVASAGASLGGAGPPADVVDNTGAIRVLRITVTASGPANESVTLDAYRTNFACNVAGDAECKPN